MVEEVQDLGEPGQEAKVAETGGKGEMVEGEGGGRAVIRQCDRRRVKKAWRFGEQHRLRTMS